MKKESFYLHENKENSQESENNKEDTMKSGNIFSYSNEGYKNKTIISFNDIDMYFNSSNEENLSLFGKKEKANKLIIDRETDKSISIDKILSFDNTNKKAQKEYLTIAVNLLEKEEDFAKKEILFEKIQKAGIILTEKDYNDEIIKLPEKYQEKLIYHDYKKILIKSLKLIKEKDFDENTDEIIESFQFKKKFEFNQESIIGENNYYFYMLIFQLMTKNLYHISRNIFLYEDYIQKSIDFLEQHNFSKLSKKEIDYFDYLMNILIDNEFISTIKDKKQIDNYLETFGKNCVNYTINFSKLTESCEQLNKIPQNNKIFYKFYIDNNKLNIKISDCCYVSRKQFKKEKVFSYDLGIFNKGILEILQKEINYNNYYDFESLFFSNISYGNESKFYENFRPKFEAILKKILKSNSSKKYFEKYYKSKYPNLSYHFDRPEVINQIFKRIKFAPIFKKRDNAYTNPFELKILLNSIPGSYNKPKIRIFERRIFQFGRLLVLSIHEILGHFLRRYYSFLTGNLIKFNTKEDDIVNTKPEGGFFVEKRFLGLSMHNSIGFNEILGFFSTNFNDFPILRENFNKKEELEKIVEDNDDYFDFISILGDKNYAIDKITLKEFSYYLMEGYSFNGRISCGDMQYNAIFLD